MAIIASINAFQNLNNLIQFTKEHDYIDGLIISIIKTKDNNIIVYDVNEKIVSSQLIEENNLDTLINTTFIKLDDFLKQLKDYKKRVILNIYPLTLIALSDETIQYFNEENTLYIMKIKKIIDKYPSINISLATSNNHLLQIIKNNITTYKNGYILLQDNLNYLDSDFYIISPLILDVIILTEQLNKGKELMIYTTTTNDLAILSKFFDKTKIKNDLFYRLTFITNYPEMFYNLFYR